MVITTMWLIVAIAALVMYLRQMYSTFSKAGVNHLPVVPIFGNLVNTIFKFENLTDTLMRTVTAFPDDKVVGMYEMLTPTYLVKDLETIKKITIKDFEHFVDRRNFASEVDPMFGRNLLNLRGDDWKHMRSSLSPAFTSSKIRLMVPFMVEVGEAMNKALKRKLEFATSKHIDVQLKDLTTRYANDVIASCAFGLKVDSQSLNNVFYSKTKEVTAFSTIGIMKIILLRCFPNIGKMLCLRLASNSTSTFFKDIVLGTMKNREENNVIRHDMIHLLNEMKKGTLSHDKEAENDADYATTKNVVGKKSHIIEWTDDDLVAQAVIFLFAGFDTVSTAMTFILHELAVHPEIQERLVEEIREHYEENNGKIDFNSIQSMKYLDMVVSEGLRMYPAASFVDRKCVKDYNFGRVNKNSIQDLMVSKGDVIGFPIWTFHRNPELFPEPLKFDPERFSEENKHKIKPLSYMPFGLGPRNCIGSRFALCEVKVMLYQLLREIKVVPCEKTVIPAQLVGGFLMNIVDGGWARLQLRE